MQIVRVIPLSSYKTTLKVKQRLNGEKWDGELSHLPVFGWAVLFSWGFLFFLIWKNKTKMTATPSVLKPDPNTYKV